MYMFSESLYRSLTMSHKTPAMHYQAISADIVKFWVATLIANQHPRAAIINHVHRVTFWQSSVSYSISSFGVWVTVTVFPINIVTCCVLNRTSTLHRGALFTTISNKHGNWYIIHCTLAWRCHIKSSNTTLKTENSKHFRTKQSVILPENGKKPTTDYVD